MNDQYTLLDNMTDDELQFIMSFRFKGRTVKSWVAYTKFIRGYDRFAIPKHDKYYTITLDAINTAKEIYNHKIMKKLIPPGQYCYVHDFTKPSDNISIPIVSCPHRTEKDIAGVQVPWCKFLNSGGTENSKWSEEEWQKLITHFGSENNLFDNLPLSLLWDDCKECDVNTDVEITRDAITAWIELVK